MKNEEKSIFVVIFNDRNIWILGRQFSNLRFYVFFQLHNNALKYLLFLSDIRKKIPSLIIPK